MSKLKAIGNMFRKIAGRSKSTNNTEDIGGMAHNISDNDVNTRDAHTHADEDTSIDTVQFPVHYPVNPLPGLPVEILLEIANHLTAQQDLSSLSKTSRRMRRIMQNKLYEHIKLPGFKQKAIQVLEAVCSDSDLARQVKSLELDHNKRRLDSRGTQSIAELIRAAGVQPNRTIYTAGESIIDVLAKILARSDYRKLLTIYALVSALPDLEVLEIDPLDLGWRREGACHFQHTSRSLRKLVLKPYGSYRIDLGLYHFLQQMPELTEIHLKLTDYSWSDLGYITTAVGQQTALPWITKLTISAKSHRIYLPVRIFSAFPGVTDLTYRAEALHSVPYFAYLDQITCLPELSAAAHGHGQNIKRLQIHFEDTPIPHEPYYSAAVTHLQDWVRGTFPNTEHVLVSFPGKELVRHLNGDFVVIDKPKNLPSRSFLRELKASKRRRAYR